PRSTKSGLMKTSRPEGSRPTERSTTNRRRGTPTCGAANPTPGAAYMVSIMSSMRRSVSDVIASTGVARSWRIGSPYLRIGRIILPSNETGRRALPKRPEVLDELLDGVAAELFDRRIGQNDRDHGLADDRRG